MCRRDTGRTNNFIVIIMLKDFRCYPASPCNVQFVLGESLPMTGDLLGHRKVNTTPRYAHLEQDSVRVSSAKVAADIGAKIAPPDGQ